MREPVTDPARFRQLVAPLVGTWTGVGYGHFPTITPFDYREELELALRSGEDTLRYEQRTWRLGPDAERPSHWEVGLCWLDGEGRACLSAAQNGRSEAMRGQAWHEDGTLVLELASLAHALDDRVAATTRTWRLGDGSIEYEMQLATRRVPTLRPHLRNRLERGA